MVPALSVVTLPPLNKLSEPPLTVPPVKYPPTNTLPPATTLLLSAPATLTVPELILPLRAAALENVVIPAAPLKEVRDTVPLMPLKVKLPVLVTLCTERPLVPDMVATAADPIVNEGEAVPTSTADRMLPAFNVIELVLPSAPATVACNVPLIVVAPVYAFTEPRVKEPEPVLLKAPAPLIPPTSE